MVDGSVVADVGRLEERALPEPLGESAAALFVDVRDCNRSPACVQRLHDRVADQGRAAADDRRLPIELEHSRLLDRVAA